jgi:hypothetical protein
MVTLRLRNGRRRKAQMGRVLLGAPALGLEARDGDLIKSKDEQRTIERIVELRDAGVSFVRSAPPWIRRGHRTKRGGAQWQPMSVKRMLDRLGSAA